MKVETTDLTALPLTCGRWEMIRTRFNHTTIWIRLPPKVGTIISLSFCRMVVWRFRSRTCTTFSRVRIPTTARQSGSEVRLVVSTFKTLIQYVYINRSSTDCWSTGWGQMSFYENSEQIFAKHARIVLENTLNLRLILIPKFIRINKVTNTM